MVDPKIAQGWLDKADEDSEYAKTSLEEGIEFYSPICFHFHQAAEKYLKAYIVAKELDFKKVHDLKELLRICESNDSEFGQLSDLVSELNPYYIETRYPEFIGSIDKFQAEEAGRIVDKIATFVKSKLQ